MTSNDTNSETDARSIQPQQTTTAADAVPFLIVGATLSDPGHLLASVAQSGDDITLTTAAASISNSPDTALSWERPLTSVFGGAGGFALGDVFRAIGRVHEFVPPADMHFGMSIESADGARGAAWRIAAVGATWQVQHGAKVAGSWGAWTVATSQAMTRAFEGQLVAGTGNIQARISNMGLDAVGVSTGGAGNTSPTSNNVGPELTRLKVFVGYVTGSGGSAGSLTFKASHILAKRLEWPALARAFSIPAALADRATRPTTFVIAGQSNADGVAADAHAGEALLPGTSINDRGIDLTVMPDSVERDGAKRHCGPLPYLDRYARRAGATAVNILRLAANGQSISACLQDFPVIVSRLAAKGWAPEYWYFAQGEASTTEDATTPAAEYHAQLTHYVELILATFPECRVAIQSLPMHTVDYGGPGNSASYPIVEAAQRLVCDEHPGRVLLVDSRGTPLDPRQVPLSHDEVHLSVDDGGGFDVMMARFREVWALPEAELVQTDVLPDPDVVMLRDDTRWLGTLHVSLSASPDMLALALDAERILLAMCGDAITRDATPGAPGILLGLFSDWAADDFGFTDGVPDYVLTQGHEYIVVSVGQRVLILGETYRATAYALYRFTELLGHRQLLPTSIWEVIEPHLRITVRLAIGETSLLDFVAALGAAGGIGVPDAEDRLDAWKLKNRIPVGGYVFGHAYGQIVKDNQAEFDLHPEYLGSSNKLCVLESGLRDLAYDWVLGELAAHPDRVVQTLAAADGTAGWDAVCIGTNEQATHSPSDRQLILANDIQERISATGVRLSIQAYGATSPAPTVCVDPRLAVIVTDGFFQNGLTWQQVADGYRAMGATDTLPYAYTAVWPFDVGIPGSGRASDLSLMALDAARAVETPGTLHGLVAECPSCWAPWGLGYWVLAKLCTDRTTTTDVSVLRQTFLDSAFGRQSPILSNFYAILETTAPLTEDRIHRLYQWLSDAIADGPTVAVRARLDDLTIYVRYLELLLCWTRDQEVTSFDAMVAWLWRARDKDLLPVRLSYTQPAAWQPWYARLEALYPSYTFSWFSQKPSTGPWALQDQPFADAELDAIITSGLQHNALLPFEPVGFSTDLVYVAHPPDSRPPATFLYSHRNHSFHLFMRQGQTTWIVEHRAGYVDNADGSAFLNVIEISSGEVVARVESLVDETTTSHVPLQENTLYLVEVVANSGVHWSCPGFSTTKLTNLERSMYQGGFSGYFLVPAGTTEIGGYANRNVRFSNPARALIHTTVAPDYFVFTIDPPLAHEIWKVENVNATFALLMTPPGLAPSPDALLVPRELAQPESAPTAVSRRRRPRESRRSGASPRERAGTWSQ